MYSPLIGENGECPSASVWEMRADQFRRLEFLPLGEQPHSKHPQLEPLIHELEHLYCSGAWLATLVFANSLVEVFLFSKGMTSKKQWNEFLKARALDNEVQWLNDRRNDLLHIRDTESPSMIRIEDVLFNRDVLFTDAKRAVSIAFRIVFMET